MDPGYLESTDTPFLCYDYRAEEGSFRPEIAV